MSAEPCYGMMKIIEIAENKLAIRQKPPLPLSTVEVVFSH